MSKDFSSTELPSRSPLTPKTLTWLRASDDIEHLGTFPLLKFRKVVVCQLLKICAACLAKEHDFGIPLCR